jgi:hypothetical protein
MDIKMRNTSICRPSENLDLGLLALLLSLTEACVVNHS